MNNHREERITPEDKAALTDDKQVKFPKRTIVISLAILLSMFAVATFWFRYINNYDWSQVSLSDIGAMLSGTFTALAWYWFVEAYLIQTKELRYQRLDLRESIKAQQGTENALKSQSNALERQLAITEKQFHNYQTIIMGKQPNFELVQYDGVNVFFFDLNGSPDEQILSRGASISLQEATYIKAILNLKIKNIAGDCILKDIKTSDKGFKEKKIEIDFKSYKDDDNYHLKIDLHLGCGSSFNHQLFPMSYSHLDSKIVYKKIDELLSNLLLYFFYSYDNTSSSNTYQLKIRGDDATLSLIPNAANPANSC